MSEQPTILVTGAAGFIGSHTTQRLLDRGCRVIGVDNFCNFYKRRWKELNVESLQPASRFELAELDITDAEGIDRLMEKTRPAAIIHLAAMAGVRPSIERPVYYAGVNVDGTAILLQAAVKHKVQKFLFASSSSVYGNQPKVPFAETDPVDEPISPYASTKRAGELMAYTYWHLYRLPVFCLRFFTVYGPRQRPDLAIHKFARLIAGNQPIPLFGDGSTSRDYTFVEDTVDGIMAALDRCDRYRIYNLGGSHPITLATLVSELEHALGKKAIIDRQPPQPGDVERTYADLSRSGAELDYRPKVSIRQGLERFVQWFRENGHLYQ